MLVSQVLFRLQAGGEVTRLRDQLKEIGIALGCLMKQCILENNHPANSWVAIPDFQSSLSRPFLSHKHPLQDLFNAKNAVSQPPTCDASGN